MASAGTPYRLVRYSVPPSAGPLLPLRIIHLPVMWTVENANISLRPLYTLTC